MTDKIYKYRMDFYYQLLVIYLIFFTLYVIVRGSLEERFGVIFNDPIFYILIFFISLFLVIVVMNIIRSRQIIIREDRVVFKNRFGSREVMFSDLASIRIGRRKRRSKDFPYRIIKLKLRNRRRTLRIRANDFEKGPELIREFLKLRKPGTV